MDPVPEEALPPDDALARAEELLAAGRAFGAHEVLEAAWKAAPAAERELWRGLAQVAVGLCHLQRGNRRGAVALLRRGSERVAGFAGRAPHRIAARAVAATARGLAERADAGEDVPVPALPLRQPEGCDPEAR
ncbi:MAG TPA: DUF309 domain-containing protein [Mycobacteriales bacterium]|nr:DUF309 domain-containing protein [Mycobacteriales bacterium]